MSSVPSVSLPRLGVLAAAAGLLGFAAVTLRSAAPEPEVQMGLEVRRLGAPSFSCGGSLCGFLVLETGQGTGFYKHDDPTVHGLWPQVSPYGDSSCIKPRSSEPNPTGWVPSCYQGGSYSKDPDHQASFVLHEWTRHGACAGSVSEDNYFQQICDLAASPIAIMASDIAKGGDVHSSASALQAAGYPVAEINPMGQGQVMLSACGAADSNGTYSWKLAPVGKFGELCGSAPSPPAPAPGPSPSPASSCVPSKHGPHCTSDADCQGVSGCIRCAHSGFCTADPALELFL